MILVQAENRAAIEKCIDYLREQFCAPASSLDRLAIRIGTAVAPYKTAYVLLDGVVHEVLVQAMRERADAFLAGSGVVSADKTAAPAPAMTQSGHDWEAIADDEDDVVEWCWYCGCVRHRGLVDGVTHYDVVGQMIGEDPLGAPIDEPPCKRAG